MLQQDTPAAQHVHEHSGISSRHPHAQGRMLSIIPHKQQLSISWLALCLQQERLTRRALFDDKQTGACWDHHTLVGADSCLQMLLQTLCNDVGQLAGDDCVRCWLPTGC